MPYSRGGREKAQRSTSDSSRKRDVGCSMTYDGLLRITFTRVARVQKYIEKRARREAGTKTVLVAYAFNW